MVEWFYTLILCISALLFSLFGTLAARDLARYLMPPREPNERDNHAIPTPKGGGVAVMIALCGFLTVAGMDGDVILALVMLTLVSLIDDVHMVSPKWRLLVHGIAACLMVGAIKGPVLHGLVPPTLEFPLLLLALVWCMNLYNFMDGIDELTAAQTTAMCAGLIALAVLFPNVPNSAAYDGLIIISAVVGFWWFNRHPASIFLGDSGSVPLGALMGWLLLNLSAHGQPAAALILPAYYLVDSGVTLARRTLAGKKIWQAHSEHGYQCYVRSGASHVDAVLWISVCNLVLVALALASAYYPDDAWLCVLAAYGLALALFTYFRIQKPQVDVRSGVLSA